VTVGESASKKLSCKGGSLKRGMGQQRGEHLIPSLSPCVSAREKELFIRDQVERAKEGKLVKKEGGGVLRSEKETPFVRGRFHL